MVLVGTVRKLFIMYFLYISSLFHPFGIKILYSVLKHYLRATSTPSNM